MEGSKVSSLHWTHGLSDILIYRKWSWWRKKKAHKAHNFIYYNLIRKFDAGSKVKSGPHWTGQGHSKCNKNGAIVLLNCICSIAFIGTIDSKRGQFTGGALSSSFFLLSFQSITLFWPHVRERRPLIFHFSSLAPALVDKQCHLVSGSSFTRWSNLGLRHPHEASHLCIRLQVLHYHDRRQADGRCTRPCMCPV